jgi:AcrR family transcriptional regulator
MVSSLSRARRLPPAERRAAIVAAAVPLVRLHGRAVTTGQIAEAARVSEGTLFHVFPDKAAIVDAVVEAELCTDGVLAELQAIEPGAALRPMVVEVVEVLSRRLDSVFELMTAVGLHRPPEPAGHHQRHRELLAVVAEKLRPRAEELRFTPEESADLIRLLTFAASHPVITDHRPHPAEQIADVLLDGIAARPAHPGADPC